MTCRDIPWFLAATLLTGGLIGSASAQTTVSLAIPRVQAMPMQPQPFKVRDWKQVANTYVDFAFDFTRTGPNLPLIRWYDNAHTTFFLPSYVGGGGPEAITCIASVVSATLIGRDMTTYRGQNWVELCPAYYNPQSGLYWNNPGSSGSGSFWYDIFPNILFYQLYDRYPSAQGATAQMASVASHWQSACVAMGGSTNPFTPPNFDHTGFWFPTMKPNDNGQWIEPDAAAGIAWLEYMAWTKTADSRYLTAVDWCLQALQARPVAKNPLYEVLLPYGAFVAARMNAELGRNYDVQKLLNWCFDPGSASAARPGWGVIADRFGQDDCDGLVGSVTDTNGYAFAMNTFEWAGALTPLARYDARYARDIGRWMLNLVNASRLLYANGVGSSQQDDLSWSSQNDPSSCLSYEGLRKQALRANWATADTSTAQGTVRSGSYASTFLLDGQNEVLEEATIHGSGSLDHTWLFPMPPGQNAYLWVHGQTTLGDSGHKGFTFLYSGAPSGPFTPLFTVNSPGAAADYYGNISGVKGKIYIKARTADRTGTSAAHSLLSVDCMRVGALDPTTSPFATGDALRAGWAPHNFALYGAAHVGILGALVMPTSDPEILSLNLLATDYFHAPAYPTYLLYNPYPATKNVSINVGSSPQDIFDAGSHTFIMRSARGSVRLSIPSNTALVLVLVPPHGAQQTSGHQLLVNGIVVDYHYK